MAKWDKKYFVTTLKDVVGAAPWSPVFADNEARRLLSLDGIKTDSPIINNCK